mmetsp:Transcript_26921/g.58790  ORF Transcript_26921/g.58790 Transcript_26921/m.58790 type:complete len:110 (-) Transcript_26921:91-420(-)
MEVYVCRKAVVGRSVTLMVVATPNTWDRAAQHAKAGWASVHQGGRPCQWGIVQYPSPGALYKAVAALSGTREPDEAAGHSATELHAQPAVLLGLLRLCLPCWLLKGGHS